jgi:hypothetical protein
MWALHMQHQQQQLPPDGEPNLVQLTLFDAWGIEPPPQIAQDLEVAQQAAVAAALAATLSPVQKAEQAAVANFWSRLQEFTILHAECKAKRWAGAELAANPPLSTNTHPYMQIRTTPSGGRRLHLVVPDGQAPFLPADPSLARFYEE